MMVLGCMHALLLATAHTEPGVSGAVALQHGAAKAQGHTATTSRNWPPAAPPPAAASPAAPPDTSEAAVRCPASLPLLSAARGELQTVVEWLRKGGAVDAFDCPTTTDGRPSTTFTLLHAAAAYNHLAMVRELLKRGASVDLPSSTGGTALMGAAGQGHLSMVLVLLQHSANPDLQCSEGATALIRAAQQGHEACVQALLRAKANTELLDKDGFAAL